MKRRRLAAILTVLAMLFACAAQGESKKTMFEQEWYLQALKDSVMSTGNNARIKNVIARAQSGEVITLATIRSAGRPGFLSGSGRTSEPMAAGTCAW